jgi:hypothetical protein
MDSLKKLGRANEHAIDRTTIEEFKSMAGFGKSTIEMIKAARGLSGDGKTNLLDPKSVEADIFGEDEEYVQVPARSREDDGLEELVLVLRLPPRRIAWLNRLSVWGQQINPGKEHLFTVERLVVGMINNARQMDDTNGGLNTSMGTYRSS